MSGIENDASPASSDVFSTQLSINSSSSYTSSTISYSGLDSGPSSLTSSSVSSIILASLGDWTSNLRAARGSFDTLFGAAFRASVGVSIGASIETCFWASFSASFGVSFFASFGASFWVSFCASFGSSFWVSFGASFGTSFGVSSSLKIEPIFLSMSSVWKSWQLLDAVSFWSIVVTRFSALQEMFRIFSKVSFNLLCIFCWKESYSPDEISRFSIIGTFPHTAWSRSETLVLIVSESCTLSFTSSFSLLSLLLLTSTLLMAHREEDSAK